jgi:hypothetical protein
LEPVVDGPVKEEVKVDVKVPEESNNHPFLKTLLFEG